MARYDHEVSLRIFIRNMYANSFLLEQEDKSDNDDEQDYEEKIEDENDSDNEQSSGEEEAEQSDKEENQDDKVCSICKVNRF